MRRVKAPAWLALSAFVSACGSSEPPRSPAPEECDACLSALELAFEASAIVTLTGEHARAHEGYQQASARRAFRKRELAFDPCEIGARCLRRGQRQADVCEPGRGLWIQRE